MAPAHNMINPVWAMCAPKRRPERSINRILPDSNGAPDVCVLADHPSDRINGFQKIESFMQSFLYELTIISTN